VAGAWDVVGRKVSKTQILTDIYETARTSIGLPLPLDAPAIRMFRMVVAEARSLIRQRNEIETQADELLRHSPDYHLLRQIPGIGPINALTIIAEAGDLRRFHHHRQFLKFCPPELRPPKRPAGKESTSSTPRLCARIDPGRRHHS
jgi:transposase